MAEKRPDLQSGRQRQEIRIGLHSEGSKEAELSILR